MERITKATMISFYKTKSKLMESQEILNGLYEYKKQLMKTGERKDILKSLNEDISQLEIKNNLTKKDLEAKGNDIKETLGKVENDTARVGLLMHYYDGLSWEIIGNILRISTDNIRAHAYRHLRKTGIK